MGRWLAIDYGLKRCGIAVSDPLGIIATPLTTVPTHTLLSFLETYANQNELNGFVLGMPKKLNNTPTQTTKPVLKLADQIKKKWPQFPIHWVDERYTTTIAHQSLLESGVKKMDRRDKENVDKISATLILQTFMASI